jgi:hypothetical protein
MIKITLLLALVASIAAFAESANARSNDNYNYSNSSRNECMYKGYPCREWTRPDSY